MKQLPPDANPPIRLLMAASQRFQRPQPNWIVQAPGREMWIAAVLREDYDFFIAAEDYNADTSFSHRSAKVNLTIRNRPLPKWARYPAGVLVTLGDAGVLSQGFDAVVLGDEPQGPRYEYAMGLAFAAFGYALADQPATEAMLGDVVEGVRRDYLS